MIKIYVTPQEEVRISNICFVFIRHVKINVSHYHLDRSTSSIKDKECITCCKILMDSWNYFNGDSQFLAIESNFKNNVSCYHKFRFIILIKSSIIWQATCIDRNKNPNVRCVKYPLSTLE